MKKSDKIVAAFLVSAGLFSAGQVVQYVAGLSDCEKNSIASAAKSTKVAAADGAILGTNGGNDNPKSASNKPRNA